MHIEILGEDEGPRWRAVRLAALADSPEAFSTRLEDCQQWSDARWTEQVGTFHTVVAVEQGKVVGVVRGAPDAGWAVLLSMWVSPSARRRGVGRALVEQVVTWARDGGFERVELEVGTRNTAARRLYERCGFVTVGPASDDAEVLMVRDLTR